MEETIDVHSVLLLFLSELMFRTAKFLQLTTVSCKKLYGLIRTVTSVLKLLVWCFDMYAKKKKKGFYCSFIGYTISTFLSPYLCFSFSYKEKLICTFPVAEMCHLLFIQKILRAINTAEILFKNFFVCLCLFLQRYPDVFLSWILEGKLCLTFMVVWVQPNSHKR